MSCKVSEEVKDILDKIDKYREKNNKPKDEKVKPLSEYELNRLPKLPDKWSWVLSNDISTFITNGVHSPTSQQDLLNINMKMLRITDIDENGKSDLTGLPYCTRFTEKDYDKTIKRNDIYISFTGNKLGKRYLAKQSYNDIVFAHYFVRWQPIIVNPRYIYYVVLSHHFDRFMFEHTLGSAQPNLKVTDLKRVPIPLAPLEEQEKIANILSSLDDKIELNNEMNKTLEEMAQSIFKRWFVDFEFPNEDGQSYKSSGGEMVESELGMIPKGWEIKEFGETDIIIEDGDRGKNYPNKSQLLKEGYCPFLNNKNIINDKINFKDCDFISEKRDQLLRKGKININDIILTTRGTVGNVGILHEELDYKFARINSGMVIIKNNSYFNLMYLYSLMKSDYMKEQYKSMSTGTAQPQLPIKDIKKIKILIPGKNIQIECGNILKSLYDKIFQNEKEISILMNQRESILPKLMNGDITIK